MPLNKHFGGSGQKVWNSMKASHPEYSADRLKRMFYSTENAKKGKHKAYSSLIK